MKNKRPSVTGAQQQFTFSRRAVVLGTFQFGIGGLLAARMGWLSIAQNEKYALLAESNRVNLTLTPPRRGWIVDRAGKPLALNRTSFRVDIIPDRLKDRDAVLAQLQPLMGLSNEVMARIRADVAKAAGFQPVAVAENIDWETFAAVSIRVPDLPGVAPAQSFTRYYPTGAAVGHLLGYVGAATAEMYEKTKDPLLVTPGFKVGKEGLEKTMEPILRGEPGAKRTEVTARGKLVRELANRPDTPGKTLHLTVDAGLQDYVARRLGNESGSAVVIDCMTGGILAMASMPSYDPNSFSDGISRREWKMLREDDHIPLLNKPLQALYPPGSTLKPMAALAMLRAGVDPEETVHCGGGYTLGNRTFRCLGRHGAMNMRSAIMKSCNTYFYAMGRRIGYDKIAVVARELGLGQEYDLPFPSQRYGTVPDSAWKKKKYDQDWSQSDTLNATIGQGYVLTSPLQLAVMSARIASGLNLSPKILSRRYPAEKPLVGFPAEHLAIVREGMDLVVNGAGTAVRSRLPFDDIKMAGKTGTAQVRAIKDASRGGAGASWKYRDHGLFVSFAPVEAPRYAAAIVIDHGLGGARAAAPVAKDIYTYLFDNAKGMAALEALEAGWGGDINTRMAKKAASWQDPDAKPPATHASVGDAEVSATANSEVKRQTEANTPRPAAEGTAQAPPVGNTSDGDEE